MQAREEMDPAPEQGKSKASGPWKRRLLIASALMVCAFVAMVLGRNRWVAPFVLARLQPKLEASLGGRLDVGRFEGDWLSGLTLLDVHFQRSAEAGPLVRFDASKLVAKFDLWDLLREGIGGLVSLEMDVQHLGLEPGSALPGARASQTEDDDEPMALPAHLPEVNIRIDRIDLVFGEGSLVTDDFTLEVQADRVHLAAREFDPRALAPGSPRGELVLDLVWQGGRIELGEAHFAQSLVVGPGEIDLTQLAQGNLSWALPLALLGMDERDDAHTSRLTSAGSIASEGDLVALRAQASSEAFDLSLLSRYLPPTIEPLQGLISLEIEVSGAANDLGSWLGQFELGGEDLALGERRIDRLQARGKADEELLSLAQLLVISGDNEFNATELLVPLGASTVAETVAATEGDLRLSLADLPGLLELLGTTDEHLGLRREVPEHALQLACSLSSNSLKFEAGSAVAGGGKLQLKRGSVQFADDPGDMGDWWREALLDVELGVDIADLGPVARIFEREDFAGSVNGQLRLEGTPAAPSLRLEAHAREASLGALNLGGLDFSASLSGPLDALDGEIELTLDNGRLEGTSLQKLSLHGELTRGRLDVDRLTARIDDFELDAAISGSWQAQAQEGWIELARLSLTRAGQTVRLAAPARITRQAGVISLVELALEGTGGRLIATASVEEHGGKALGKGRIGAVFEDFELDSFAAQLFPTGFASSPLKGRAEAAWVLSDGSTRPELELALQLAAPALKLGPSALPLAFEVDLSFEQELLAIEQLVVSRVGLGRVSLRGHLPLDPLGEEALRGGELDLLLEARTSDIAAWPQPLREALFGMRTEVSGGLELKGLLGGSWERLTGTLFAQGTQLVLTDRVSGQALEDVQLELQVELNDSLRISRGKVVLGKVAELDLEGECDTGIDLRAFARGDFEELLAAPLRATLALDAADLSWISAQLREVRRLEGALEAEVSVGGTLGTPEFAGSVALREINLRLSNAFPALQEVTADLQLTSQRLRLERFSGHLGGAQFQLEGVVDDLADNPRLDFELIGDDLLLYRNEGTRVRADTKIKLEGPLEALLVKGKIDLTDGRYGDAIKLLSGLSGEAKAPSAGRGIDLSMARAGPLANLRFDLDIGAKHPFLIRTNLVKGDLRPSLHLAGSGRVPLLDGSVFLGSTNVSLPSGVLRIDAGRVLFDERDPFVPKLELSGAMRLKGFDVVALVSGDFDDPVVRLSSTPPLPSQDLLVLFLTGQLPEGTTSSRSRAAAQSVAVYLAKDYVSRWLSDPSDSDEETILTRIDLSIGNDITRSGSLTTEVTYLLSERTQGPGRERYLAGERDVYDKINFGYGWHFRFE